MGEVFAGRYELVDPIGRGGVGAVWRAWDQRRRRYVAAKVLQQSESHALLRFVREQALRIDHPHVLAPASWAADDDKVLFTMDLMRGGSLAQLIADYGPLPPTLVCTLLDQLLSGLSAVHAEDVVHRDIKPANLLLDATGRGRPHLRLSDFGISMRKGEPRLTETNFVVGTPGYFAPEQLQGAEPDFSADLYAVGLVALYLLSATKPDSTGLVAQYQKQGVPPTPEYVPEPLWQVLSTLLRPDPQDRFRTAVGARKALADVVPLLTTDSTLEQDVVEVFDQLGPLPPGFDESGPTGRPGTDAKDSGPSGPRPAAPDNDFSLAPPRTGLQDTPPTPTGPYWSPGAPAPAPVTPTPTETPGARPGDPYPGVPAAGGQQSGHPGAHPGNQPGPYGVHPPQPAPGTAPTPPGGGRPFADPGAPPGVHQGAPPGVQPGAPAPAPYGGPVGGGMAGPIGGPVDPPSAPTVGSTRATGPSGPSPRVAVAVIVLALLCFGVAIWALTSI
ncbi:protein kinase [Streptomyces sp. NPDC005438]|uniref:serine/threonine-protein kinase n=1 Tax=Streptomyces sp. NPDC005438 TaxID=3156880 RepID=UPI0033BDC130